MVLTIATTLAFFAVAIAVSIRIGIPIRDPEGTLLGKRAVLPLIFMGIFFLIDVYIRARHQRADYGNSIPRAIAIVFIERWWWRRALIAIVGFFTFHLCYLSYRNLKSFIPLTNFHVYDKELARTDEILAFGHTPGPFLHDLLGTGASAHFLSVIYIAFIPAVAISVAAALTFFTRLRDGYVYVAAMNWCWILGTASYYLIPTLGPFGRATWDFDDLPRTGVTQIQEALIKQRSDLLADPLGDNVVQSVAGFASLHTGIVAMAMFFAWHYRKKLLAWALFVALIPTVIATIYFGWHYILDDVAGLILAWMSLRLALWTVYPAQQGKLVRSLWARVRGRAPSPPTVESVPDPSPAHNA